jgi:hypothetical protein
MVHEVSITHTLRLKSYLRYRRNAAVALAGAVAVVAVLLSFILHI